LKYRHCTQNINERYRLLPKVIMWGTGTAVRELILDARAGKLETMFTKRFFVL